MNCFTFLLERSVTVCDVWATVGEEPVRLPLWNRRRFGRRRDPGSDDSVYDRATDKCFDVDPELSQPLSGSDSKRNAAVGGDDLRKSRLGIAEHAATVKPHATTAMTLLMT
jgi:hypothetical protein